MKNAQVNQTSVHTQTQTHTYTHTHTHRHTQTHRQTHTQTHTHRHTLTHRHTQTHTHTYTPGTHCWTKPKQAAVRQCPFSWFQSDGAVNISVFAKCIDPEQCSVRANSDSVGQLVQHVFQRAVVVVVKGGQGPNASFHPCLRSCDVASLRSALCVLCAVCCVHRSRSMLPTMTPRCALCLHGS